MGSDVIDLLRMRYYGAFHLSGEKAYVTLRSLLLPKTPTEVKYEDAKKVLQQQYALKRSVVTERYHFN
ncbi:hypothetical protein MTO96_001250 [Rhipicephalus appendiculatus]